MTQMTREEDTMHSAMLRLPGTEGRRYSDTWACDEHDEKAHRRLS